jgi:hypothetical protein
MSKCGRFSKKCSVLLGLVLFVFPLGLSGCQPEGTGTVKGPSDRPADSSLGRPFGNEPEIKKKAETSKAKEVVQPLNPKL